MSWLDRLCSPCAFGHAADPLLVRHKGKTYFECRRCQTRYATPLLAGQKFKARPTASSPPRTLRFRPGPVERRA